MLTLFLLTLFDPRADAEIVWNKAGTWGAYTVRERDNSLTTRLFLVDKGKRARRHVVTGRYLEGAWSKGQSGEFVMPAIEEWAPDGQHLLFYKGHYDSVAIDAHGAPLFDVNVKTGEVRKLTMSFVNNLGFDDDRITYDLAIAFSPDGKKLLLVMGECKFPTINKRIALLDYKTLERKWLTGREIAATSPSWSLDGTKIAFCSNPSTLSEDELEKSGHTLDFTLYAYRRIWIMNADGTGKKQLTREYDTYPIWRSKDVIEFIRGEDEVWSMRPDGSAQKYVRELGDGSNFWRYGAND